jgi:hypothetical protein
MSTPANILNDLATADRLVGSSVATLKGTPGKHADAARQMVRVSQFAIAGVLAAKNDPALNRYAGDLTSVHTRCGQMLWELRPAPTPSGIVNDLETAARLVNNSAIALKQSPGRHAEAVQRLVRISQTSIEGILSSGCGRHLDRFAEDLICVHSWGSQVLGERPRFNLF